MKALVLLLPFITGVVAQQTLYGQCGGIGWTGATTCVSPACCVYGNEYYSQCLDEGNCSSSSSTTTSIASTTSSSSSVHSSTTSSTSKISSSTTITTTATSTTSTYSTTATFTNPVIYEDFADNDIFLGPDNTFYYSASNMHYSPGAPILKSYDLVNWEFIGHSVPSLGAFGSQYNMTGNTTAYREGTWASTLRYRESNGLWYWIGCIDFWTTYIYTAPDVTGPWSQSASMPGTCYYDCGLLIDDDDTMYVVYGATEVYVAQLASDGLSQVQTVNVFNASDCGRSGIEGNRLYKYNGTYYILDDDSQGTTVIWKATSPFGPYTYKFLQDGIASPIADGGTVDQGSLITTPGGAWYFMSFSWAYPCGRMPILAPITWGSDGFPVLTEVDGAWGESYPLPLPADPIYSWTFTDTFEGTALGVSWEWNQNPDSTKYSINNGLTLETATVTQDLYHARNTLTHRVHGPLPVGTVAINFENMADGDVAGLAAFRDQTSWIGVVRNGSDYTLQMRYNATQDQSTWDTTSVGTVEATTSISQTNVWFKVTMDARSAGTKLAVFYYSLDGNTFTQLGPSFEMDTDWEYFMGYRYAIFNFAGKALGGSILVTEFINGESSS